MQHFDVSELLELFGGQMCRASVAYAISVALNEAVALSRDDLIVQTARLFGFDRTGPDLTQEIEREVNSLIQGRTVVYDGEKLRVT